MIGLFYWQFKKACMSSFCRRVQRCVYCWCNLKFFKSGRKPNMFWAGHGRFYRKVMTACLKLLRMCQGWSGWEK